MLGRLDGWMFGMALCLAAGCGGETQEPAGEGGNGGGALGELECRRGEDCDNDTCNPVSDAACYEVQSAASCRADEDCAGMAGEGGGAGGSGGGAVAPFICEIPHFTCPPPLQVSAVCVRGCATDADCPATLACAPDHRCRAKPCAADADCPVNQACDPTGGACARKACASDADCEGYCVLGQCEEKPGICFLY
ncbi:hypothetical protein WME98_51495 [Sorangium sp. So ce296]|uniref:hypothetical protein n=1 Tax=Sorangium sp. So ce296 TaxID=3133296 RepID=UPI003F5E0619